MAQNTDVLIPSEHYTRADFTALRAWLNKLPLSRIAALYYTEDDLETLGCTTPGELQWRLERMRDSLMQRAVDTNPHAAEGLRRARMAHVWSKAAIEFLVQSADADLSTPRNNDPVSAWLKPRVAAVLTADGIRTLGDLVSTIQARGAGWWKPIPRIGAGKAASIVQWLGSHEAVFGPINLTSTASHTITETVVLAPQSPVLVPLERMRLPNALDGSQGINRNLSFSLISARDDLEAIDAYLYKFRAQEKTERSYRKELERFLLWCILERQKPLSSVMQEDCERYKDFLANPPPEWQGKKTPRRSPLWRPFAGIPSPASQRYATQVIRTYFEWLVNVRYLAGNPWLTVADPTVARMTTPIQIDKALPRELWQRLVSTGGLIDQMAALPAAELRERYALRGAATRISLPAQFRLVKAALMLMGEAGLRREEVAYATRDRLKPVSGVPELWELDVLGKRSKWRTVFLPFRAIDAIQAHWADRELDFSFGMAEIPLLSPLCAPATEDATRKHYGDNGVRKESGFSQDGLYRVVRTALTRIATNPALELTDWERTVLHQAAPHAFRHTFGTQAAAADVPLDVLQRLLGHASLQTTTIYVQAEKQRSIAELEKYFRK